MVVAGLALFVGSATATSAVAPPLRTAPFTSMPTTTDDGRRPDHDHDHDGGDDDRGGADDHGGAPATRAVARGRVIEYALAQRGRPYRKGAAGPSAFDCSGLTSAAYATIGVDLPRYSVTQAGRGRAVDWRHEPIEPGDLVFTRGDNPVIDLGHVGLAVSATEWVVAARPGVPVRVEPLPRGIQRVRRMIED